MCSRGMLGAVTRRVRMGWLMVLGCLLGCRGTTRTIFVIPRDTAEAFWVTEHTGAAEAAVQNQVALYWNGPNGEDDVEAQILLAERAIREHAMGLILSPSSPFALNTVVERALRRKMPVVILGPEVPVASAPGLFFVHADVAAMGRLAVARLDRHTQVVAITGTDPLMPGSVERAAEFAQAAAERGDVNVVARLSGPLIFGQMELETEHIIRTHPELTAIFSVNVAATRATVAAVRAMHATDRIRVIGCDQTIDLLYLLRRGEVDALVIQNMRTMGRKAVEDVVAAREHQQAEPVTVVPPALVTKANIDSDEIQALLLMDWRGKS